MSAAAEHSAATKQRRQDGRTFDQLRPLICEQRLINRADGSARISAGEQFPHAFEMIAQSKPGFAGQCAVLVAVHGPRQSPSPRREDPSALTIAVTVKPASGTAGPQEKHLATLLTNALNAVVVRSDFPRCVLDVTVQVQSADGGVAGLALCAAGLACSDAGVPLLGMLEAATVAITPGGDLIVDPTEEEEDVAASVCTAGFCSSAALPGSSGASATNGVVVSQMSGILETESLSQTLLAIRAAAATSGAFFSVSQKQLTARDHGQLQ